MTIHTLHEELEQYDSMPELQPWTWREFAMVTLLLIGAWLMVDGAIDVVSRLWHLVMV